MAIQARRQATARTRRYYNDYELRLKAKLQRRKTREEQVGQLSPLRVPGGEAGLLVALTAPLPMNPLPPGVPSGV